MSLHSTQRTQTGIGQYNITHSHTTAAPRRAEAQNESRVKFLAKTCWHLWHSLQISLSRNSLHFVFFCLPSFSFPLFSLPVASLCNLPQRCLFRLLSFFLLDICRALTQNTNQLELNCIFWVCFLFISWQTIRITENHKWLYDVCEAWVRVLYVWVLIFRSFYLN